MKIVRLMEPTDEVVNAFTRLIPQLSATVQPPNRARLQEIFSERTNTVLAARDPEQDEKIIGVLTLVVYRTPTGVHGWIEDVVVDEGERGKGVGEQLTQAALKRAAALGVKAVSLTSNPRREAANQLYQKVGFERWRTNLYRYIFRRK